MSLAKRFAAVLAVVLGLAWAAPSSAAVGILRFKGRNIIAVSTCPGDGLAGAPAGTPQYANLLTGVTFRLGCAVPGVDYRVGPPENQVFKAPTDPGAMPAGCEYDTLRHRVRCDGATDIVIDGVDLATDGGSIYLTKAFPSNNPVRRFTLRNSKIRQYWAATGSVDGACSMALLADVNTEDITLENVEIQGGGAQGSANCSSDPSGSGETIQLSGFGAKVLRYVLIKDVDQHFVTIGGPVTVGPTSTYSAKYFVLEGCGYQQGSHCNGHQFTGAQITSGELKHFLVYDRQPDVAHNGISASFTSGSPTVTVTLLSGQTQSSFRAGQSITGTRLTGTMTIVGVVDNGGNPDTTTLTLSGNADSTGSGTVSVPNMYPVGTVIGVRLVNDGGNSSLANIEISNGTFYGPGPIKQMTYNITCAGVSGFAASDNQYNPANMSGGMFNITTGTCTSRSGNGAWRMDTGGSVALP